MEYATEAIRVIEDKADDVIKPPKVVRIESRRENGNLIAIPIYKEPDQEAPGLNIEETRE